jgi:DHA2 family multidrug resistance protein-like MFS transporter
LPERAAWTSGEETLRFERHSSARLSERGTPACGAAITETGAELAGRLGVAILGSIGAAVYRSDVGTEAPSALTGAQLQTANDSLAGSVDVGGELPARGADVVDVGRTAFTHALQLSALSAALVAALLAMLAAFSPRGM